MALAVPLRGSRFVIRRGSAFFVRPLGEGLADRFEMLSYRLVSSGLARAGFERRASAEHLYEHCDSPDYFEL